jgi:3-oxoacyl-[acyl-carrier protein] reductase
MELRSSRIVITGGGGGIGLGIAEALAERGAIPIIIDRNQESIAVARQRLGCHAYLADLTKPDQVASVVDQLCAKEVPQALINNAGVIRNGMLVKLLDREEPFHSLALWDEVIQSNLTSTFLMTRELSSRMVRARARGVFVNMSSISARGNAGQGAYAAAKAGVEALTHSWAKELGPLGLRFIAVAPGFIDTPSTRAALNEEMLEELRNETPLRQLGKVTHVASAVIYALENDFITGRVLNVDGGLTL